MTTTLENPSIDTSLTYEDFSTISEVEALQEQEKQQWREFMVGPEVRQIAGEAIRIRQELGDPMLRDINYDEIMSYDDFEGARVALRLAYDFRSKDDGTYGERKDADAKADKYFYPGLSKDEADAIFAMGEKAKLRGEHLPENRKAKKGIVLGCTTEDYYTRGMFAKEKIDNGEIEVEGLVYLASERPIDQKERGDAAKFGSNATTEFEAAMGIVENLYDITIDADDIWTWVDHTIDAFPLEDQDGIPFKNRIHKVVVIAPDKSVNRPGIFIVSSAIMTDPLVDATKNGHPTKIIRTRANTPDTFETYGRLEKPEAGDRVIIFNKSRFAYQKIAAMNRLGSKGVMVDMASYGATYAGGIDDKPHQIGMEFLSLADTLAQETN